MSNFSILQLIRVLSSFNGGNSSDNPNPSNGQPSVSTPTSTAPVNGGNAPPDFSHFLGGLFNPAPQPQPTDPDQQSSNEFPPPSATDTPTNPVPSTPVTAYETFLSGHDSAVERIKKGKK